ncbi:hypothetical protein AWB91_18165 [Mycobacterium paraense]|uniref:DUF559 domain-containing protein n=1 Tax=Mycobacterium paraense TaxID=767916 RepID=A0ABX3VM79_9MYCO|nr:hypothetical protein [Mycobacterium paraense]ORW30900.1 hypothetical protein AWB91_18165 [Mycobacterium paraense]ORW42409.1 hypothetical protein AWB88_10180 [Mycobacterium paraense]
MRAPFIGSEAVAAGALTKAQLARYRRLFPDVCVDRDVDITVELRAKSAWLWTGRRGVVAGFAAAALHGSKWVDGAQAVDLLHDNRRAPPGIRTHRDRFERDEVELVAGLPITSPVRTALDLGCWYPTMAAVAAIDALARATEVKAVDVELLSRRYAGRRGIAGARQATGLFDAGAQSPKESWLRLVLVRAGLPRPQTQIPVIDECGTAFAYLDMGWEDVKVAVEYDGDQHRSDPWQFNWDVRRLERLQRRGWFVVRVTAGDRPAEIVRRVRSALDGRVCG